MSESLLRDLFHLGDFGVDEYVGVGAGVLRGSISFFRLEEQDKILRHVTKNLEFTHPNLLYPTIRAMFDIIDRIVVPQRLNKIDIMNAYYLHHI